MNKKCVHICVHCGKEIKLIEDVEMLKALKYFVDVETFCWDCLDELSDKIVDLVNQWRY